jgi:hypothetical protein
MPELEERAYFQRRLREEIARCVRFHDVFDLMLLQSMPGPGYAPNRRQTQIAARLLERRLRASDVVAAVYEDTIAVMLVGTGVEGLRDAEYRVRGALSGIGGSWHLTAWSYPEHSMVIQELELVTAA